MGIFPITIPFVQTDAGSACDEEMQEEGSTAVLASPANDVHRSDDPEQQLQSSHTRKVKMQMKEKEEKASPGRL